MAKGGRVTISTVYAANAKTARELDKFGRQTARNFQKISKQMAVMNNRGAKTVSVTNKMSKSLSHLSRLGNITVAYRIFQRVTAAIRDFANAVLEVMSHLADFENRVKVAFGVFTDVAGHMRYVSQLSNRLGVDIRASRESFAKLSVAASLSGLSLGEIKDIYESVSEAARVYNLSADRTRLSFLAIEQMINKGKVSYEELRRQLGEQIPGAFQLAAKAMGVTTKELDKLLVKGEVYTEDFLPKFARALRESVADQLEEATTRGISNIARLTNATKKWMELFSNRELEEDVGDISKETAKLVENMDWLAVALQKVLSLLTKIGAEGVKAVSNANRAIAGTNKETAISELEELEKARNKQIKKIRRALESHTNSMEAPPLAPGVFKAWNPAPYDFPENRRMSINPQEKTAQVEAKYERQGNSHLFPYLNNKQWYEDEEELARLRSALKWEMRTVEKIDKRKRDLIGVIQLPEYNKEIGATQRWDPTPAWKDRSFDQIAIADKQRKERNDYRSKWDNIRTGTRHTIWDNERARKEKVFAEQLKIQMAFEETESAQRAIHYTAMMKAQDDFNKREIEERKKMMESWSEISESVTSAFKGLANNSLTAAEAVNRLAEALLEKFAYKPFENFLTDNLSSLFGAATGAGGGDGIGSGVKGIIAALNGAGRSPGYGGGSGFNITNNFGSTVNPSTQNAIVKNQYQIFGGG